MAMMTYTSILTSLNLVVLLVLVTTYYQSYREMKTYFGAGLLIFGSMFLIEKIIALYVTVILMQHVEGTIATAMFILEIIQLLAFSILTWITIRS